MENNKAGLNCVTDSAIYDLYWKSIPMGAIADYPEKIWYGPSLLSQQCRIESI